MSAVTAPMASVADSTLYQKLNSVWHRRALRPSMRGRVSHSESGIGSATNDKELKSLEVALDHYYVP